jgi:thiol-disulfide isomerase/thioredoxin
VDVTSFALIALSLVCLLNLVLVLRIAARLRAIDHGHAQDERSDEPLPLGSPAPQFNAMTLAGQGFTGRRLAGRAVLYLFLSPSCDHCRDVLPLLADLTALARQVGTQPVVVLDAGPVRAREWLALARDEDGVTVTVPVLTAPPSRTTMVVDFNPPGFMPYFCLVGTDGTVAGRGVIGGSDWQAQLESWQTPAAVDAG